MTTTRRLALNRPLTALAAAVQLLCAATAFAAAPAKAPLKDWPHVTSAVKQDAAIEARVKEIVASMTLEQKIGQMTQPEIKTATPDDVRKYYLGSVLNGGGSWPNNNKYATAADWVKLADAYYEASMATDMKHKVPVIWGIDAMHGNSNVHSATLFPHNIGLGAARDRAGVGQMAEAVAKAVRATGINWVFAPTLAVVRDDRWGSTYESFSEDPRIVADYADVYVKGLQGNLKDDNTVVATAKHWLGDGGTAEGKDRGATQGHAVRPDQHPRRRLLPGAAGGRADGDGIVQQRDRSGRHQLRQDARQRRAADQCAEKENGLRRLRGVRLECAGRSARLREGPLRAGDQRRHRHGNGAGRLEGRSSPRPSSR
jgi:hypothetical protein